MKLFDAIIAADRYALERIEKFCHKTQRAIGWTNFTFARFAVIVASLGIALTNFQVSDDFSMTTCAISALLTTVVASLGYALVGLLEKETEKDMGRGCAGKARLHPYAIFWRLVVNFTILLFFFKSLSLGNLFGDFGMFVTGVSIALLEYLIACDPLRPSDSKLKQWFQSLFLTPIPIRNGDQ